MTRIRAFVLAFALLFVPFAALAQALATPVDQLALRVVEGNGYTVLTDMAGTPQQAEQHQVQGGGAFPEGMPQVVIDFYTRTGVQDVYITFVNLVPPGQDPAGEVVATAAEMRVLTFATEDGAATYVNDFAQEFPRQAEALGMSPDISPMEGLPQRDGAIFGYSTTEVYTDVDTGEPTDSVWSTRILAQQGSAVASAKVSSPDAMLNARQAIELALVQAGCIAQDIACAPIPLPVEFPLSEQVSQPVATEEAPAADATPAASGSTGMPTTSLLNLSVQVEEGNGYTLKTNMFGNPTQSLRQTVIAGGFEELDQQYIDYYTRTGLQEQTISSVKMAPPGVDPTVFGPIPTSIVIYLSTFSSPEGAATYVAEYPAWLTDVLESYGEPPFTLLQTVPEHDGPILGLTGLTAAYDVSNGQTTVVGEQEYVEIMAQEGSMVIHIFVGNEDSSLNLPMANELFLLQLACVREDRACDAVPPPVEFPNEGKLVPAGPPAAGVAPTQAAPVETATEAPAAAETTATRTATVIAQTANIRADASASAQVVAVASAGDTLTVTGEGVAADGYTWLPVTTGAGIQGWIADSLVSVGD